MTQVFKNCPVCKRWIDRIDLENKQTELDGCGPIVGQFDIPIAVAY